ncbi:unnamed protein product [Auanema sp. JU1783]|nr:unnamed protein product [Auanema sp. JU1783]
MEVATSPNPHSQLNANGPSQNYQSYLNSAMDFQIVRTLGEGAFGEVKLVVDSKNPSFAVAMKCLDLGKHANLLNEFKKEALIQQRLSSEGHDNVIRYIGIRMDHNLYQYQIFLEYADGGEIFDQIEPDVGLPVHRAQFYFRQLLNGLSFIHGHGIAHRDIKPENLLLTKRDTLKISDFGMATVFRHNNKERKLQASCGTLPYVAPEVLTGSYRGPPADVWSCGVVLVTLLAGELPWDAPKKSVSSYQGWINSTSLNLNPWKKIDNNALSLLRIILTENTKNRADLDRIKNHPWCTFKTDSAHIPSAKRRKLIPDLEDTVSQPIEISNRMNAIITSTIQNISFSQPDSADNLLLSNSQISEFSQHQDPILNLVRRMTRFLVVVSKSEIIPRLYAACEDCGFQAKDHPPCHILVTHREITFIITVIEMVEGGVRKVMVDIRRSRGDGIEFKRAFVALRKRLLDVVCSRGNEWLVSQGLTHSQMIPESY